MGSFSVACNLTQVSLDYDKVLWVPLIPTPNQWEDKRENSRNWFSYNSSQYVPIACPIIGNLDSYGRLENIEETHNTKALEKYFNKNIYEINQLEDITVEIKDKKVNVSGSYFSYDAFEYFKQNKVDDLGTSLANLVSAGISDEILTLIGFEQIGENNTRYNSTWENPRYPGVIWTKGFGDYGGVLHYKEKTYEYVYPITELLKTLKKLTGISPDEEVINLIKTTWSDLFYVKSKIKETQDKILSYRKINVDIYKIETPRRFDDLEIQENCKNLIEFEISDFFGFLVSGCKFNTTRIFRDIYGDPKDWDNFTVDFANLRFLNDSLAVNNRFWSPQYNCFQCGNPYQEKLLAKFLLKRANEELKLLKE